MDLSRPAGCQKESEDTMDLNEILTIAVKAKGPDIQIQDRSAPHVRIDGRLHPDSRIAPRLFSPDFVAAMSQNMMNDRQSGCSRRTGGRSGLAVRG